MSAEYPRSESFYSEREANKELRSQVAILCPDNDAESHLILKIAEKAGMSVIRSDQERGAQLDQEKDLKEKIRSLNKLELWIVEMPGVKTEMDLVSDELKVKIIDHHSYEGLNRMEDPITAEIKPSSLEQFLDLSKISDEELASWGFNPRIARGIGIMDAEYVQGLRRADYNPEEIQEVLELRRELKKELNPKYEDLLQVAKNIWDNRKIDDGFIILESQGGKEMRSVLSEMSIVYGVDTAPMIISTNNGATITVQNMKPAVIEEFRKRIQGETYSFGSGTALGIKNKDGIYTPQSIVRILIEVSAS